MSLRSRSDHVLTAKEIHLKIERAFAQFERGEFFTAEESPADLAKRKAAWLRSRNAGQFFRRRDAEKIVIRSRS
jgi:predicted transcriptional regulator